MIAAFWTSTSSRPDDYASCLASVQEALNGQPLAGASWSTEHTIEHYRSDRFSQDTLPHEMHAPFAHERRGITLGRIFIRSGDYDAALTVLGHAQAPGVEHPRRHLAKVLEGICLLRMGEAESSREPFLEALRYATMPQGDYTSLYTRGLALAGLTLSSILSYWLR